MSSPKVLQKRSSMSRRTFLMYPEIPVDGLNKIIGRIKPDVAFVAVEPVTSTHLSRLFNVTLSDETVLLLSIPPIFGVRLLRQERKLMLAQMALIIFLNDTQLVTKNIIYPTSCSMKSSPPIKTKYAPTLTAISQLIPNLLKYSLDEKDLTIPYILSTPTKGTPLSDLSIYLTIPEQRTINRQLGTLSRTLSSIKSPNQKFGLAADVLSSLMPSSSTTTPRVHGSPTWSQAFAILLESAMRDAEDMLVNLPYHEIRRFVRDYAHYFDEIKVPRLMILNLTDPDNVMVVREEFAGGLEASEGGGVRVVGLRDWSKGVFGDVVLADVWERLSSDGVDENGDGMLDAWRDFSIDANDSKEGAEHDANVRLEGDGDRDGDAEEKGVSKKFRELMYICYRAVITIATEYQRPRQDSMKRDDAGRMRLTSALKELRLLESLLDTGDV